MPDFKSLALNLAYLFLFILPIPLYIHREKGVGYFHIGVVLMLFAIAYVIPPRGWLRPHPYSDFPHNRGTAPRGGPKAD
jgi:hypothetical protein